MHSVNIWNKYHLYRAKIIIGLMITLPLASFGQRNVYENDMRYQQKHYHFGIHLGANLSDFRIKHSEEFALSD